MKYHPVTKKIVDLLKKHHFWFEMFKHPPVRTSEEAAKTRPGYTLEQGAKALILRVKISHSAEKFVMLVLPGNLKFDKRKVKNIFKAKNIRFATLEEVSKITQGLPPGGIPPFGNLFNLEVIADPKLLAKKKIVFNAGDQKISLGIFSQDYLSLVRPKIISLTKPNT